MKRNLKDQKMTDTKDRQRRSNIILIDILKKTTKATEQIL